MGEVKEIEIVEKKLFILTHGSVLEMRTILSIIIFCASVSK